MDLLELNKSTAGVMHSVNYMHRSLHNHLIRQIKKWFPKGSRILDVGCGTGAMVQTLLRLGYDAYGTDALLRGELAGRLTQEGRVTVGDFFEFEHDGEPFALVIMAEVLEHIENYLGFIAKAQELLSPQGSIIASVPNFWTARITCCPSCKCVFPPSGHIWKFQPEWFERDLRQFFAECNVSTYFNKTWTRFPLRYIADKPALNVAMSAVFGKMFCYPDNWIIAVASNKTDPTAEPIPHAQSFEESDEYLRVADLY